MSHANNRQANQMPIVMIIAYVKKMKRALMMPEIRKVSERAKSTFADRPSNLFKRAAVSHRITEGMCLLFVYLNEFVIKQNRFID